MKTQIKKVIAYKITRENKLTNKNIIKFYQEDDDDYDYNLLL